MKIQLISAAVVAAIAVMSAVPAQAYQCKGGSISAVSVHKVKLAALSKSKSNWTKRVKDRYGLAWSVYNIAEAKSKNCTKTSIGGIRKWNCRRSAKPCLYVVQ